MQLLVALSRSDPAARVERECEQHELSHPLPGDQDGGYIDLHQLLRRVNLNVGEVAWCWAVRQSEQGEYVNE
eukprot:72607-Pelagomonas_calceolata.AAC.1